MSYILLCIFSPFHPCPFFDQLLAYHHKAFLLSGALAADCMWVIPELIGHTVVTVLMLISLHWFIFLLNFPVATWNIYRYIMVPSGNMGVFDPTEIHNRGQLKSHMKEAMIKLGFHLLCFFMYLYSMILALIND
ncbi:PREDICTED: protein cornichon homolog 4 isoform X2 [Crocodylus porosus]|uniref:protein cornichon homolog 4 isoform X2 n=1 Tax=Crocodylus porosus TaxID=8502 RepID=UPI00093FB0B2|nr:PREDICTED: protein cornichon homolog 4 isoform X2 [Crocodylus porosus]